MADRIIFKNTTQEANIESIQVTDVLNGEILLVRETNKEHLYCKNSNGEISKIHRITNAGGFPSLTTSSYEAVDLGLPSGLLWAKKNIGAATEEDAGLYFQWGDIQGYTAEQVGVDKQFTWDNYKWNEGSSVTKYTNDDGLTILESIDDAATQIIGFNWRMPTADEIREMVDNTDVYFVSSTGEEIADTYTGSTSGRFQFPDAETMKGIKFYRKGDYSKYIFVPASGVALDGSVQDAGVFGCLWSSSFGTSNVRIAWCLYIVAPVGFGYANTYVRYVGFGVRGVVNA